MRIREGVISSYVLAICVGLAGCGGSEDSSDGDGDDGDDGSESAISEANVQSFEGLYQLQAFSENASGCDADGSSTFASKQQKLFVIVGSSALGVSYLALASCSDAADCATKVQAIRTPSPYVTEYSLLLSEAHGPDALGGLNATSGFLVGGSCSERDYTAHRLERSGDTLRIESRLTHLNDAPPEDGICWAEPRKQRSEAASLACAELTTFTGTKLGALP